MNERKCSKPQKWKVLIAKNTRKTMDIRKAEIDRENDSLRKQVAQFQV